MQSELDLDLSKLDDLVMNSPELVGQECSGCFRPLAYKFFEHDSSYKSGYKPLCISCSRSPKLSLAEHTARARELNMGRDDVKSQRADHQDELRGHYSKIGRSLHSSELLFKLQKLIPNMYIMPGNITGDLAVFQTYPGPQASLGGADYKYLFYVPTGWLPEFSIWSFNEDRDIALREEQRGWRTVLLRLIKSEILTEDTCRKEFGDAVGPASTRWHRQLKDFRSSKRTK